MFEADRDANAAWNIFFRGLEDVGVGYSESTSPETFDFWLANESQSDSSTSVETALPVDTPVSAKRVHQIPRDLMGCQTQSDNVVEAGSPTLKEQTASTVSE